MYVSFAISAHRIQSTIYALFAFMKLTKNAFYIILKAPFVLKIFNFLS